MSTNEKAPLEQNESPQPWLENDLMQPETIQTLIDGMTFDDVGDPMLLQWSQPNDILLNENPPMYDGSEFSIGDVPSYSWGSSMTSSDLGQSPQMNLPYWSPEPTMSLLGGTQSPEQALFGLQATQPLPLVTVMTGAADQTSIVSNAQDTHGSTSSRNRRKSSKRKCDTCGHQSKTSRDLNRHIKSCNPVLAEIMGIDTSRWHCRKCTKTFTRSDNGIRHMRHTHGWLGWN
jgi:hypothetical protein